jgi:hypothetical protein
MNGMGGVPPYYGIGYPGGNGGNGGNGNGGALFNYGSAFLINDTIASDLGAGGNGGGGGRGGNGYTPDYPGGPGGSGGSGGSGYGAIYDATGQCYLTNCTLALNGSAAGSGGGGGDGGSGKGPGQNGSAGANGAAGSGLKTTGGQLLNTILSANTPINCIGTITDAGHNLSSDNSCAFTNTGSLNNTDPKLGPLADNGGPTLTMALLPGSPAIDAGATAGAPATDQRGVPRPQGSGVDIGAFERLISPIFMCTTIQRTTNCQMQLSGLSPYQTLTLQVSSNLSNWSDLTNFTVASNGVFQCVDPIPGDTRSRFYRMKSGTP